MQEIICPKCGTVLNLDESNYDSIIKQVRNKEFLEELKKTEKQYSYEKETEIKLLTVNLEKEFNEKIKEKELKISKLEADLENNKLLTDTTLKTTKIDIENNYKEEINKLNLKILELENSLKLKETENKAKLDDVVREKEKDIITLKNKIELDNKEYILKEKNLKDSFLDKLKVKDEMICYYKDLKARQSTKMVGESLEKHCQEEFNKLRPLFKDAYFEKDNDIKSGSKGDFIFRDFLDNCEFVSIMFEMKNECDTTITKHKNLDFLKELDKDRKEKNCEYAVLVSLLELDNDYYNEGIVDMSYKYDKMYVIRPQFFIPMITLIRGASLNSLKYKQELREIQNQNLDISNFENNMNNFKESFGRNYRLASEKFKKAIEEIDKTIDHLQKTKDSLLSSENNLRIANNKAEDLTIKRLTNNSPTMQKLFEENKNKKENEETVTN